MFEAASTTKPEGGVSDDFGTSVRARALEKYCPFFHVPFQEYFVTLEMDGKSFQKGLLDFSPSYNIRKKRGWIGSIVDVFRKQHVADMLQLYENMLKPRSHAHVFFSNKQLYFWP